MLLKYQSNFISNNKFLSLLELEQAHNIIQIIAEVHHK